jgi:hypothetical protein
MKSLKKKCEFLSIIRFFKLIYFYSDSNVTGRQDDETDDDCDYTKTIVTQLSANIRQFIDTIKSCKEFVRYIKKVS